MVADDNATTKSDNPDETPWGVPVDKKFEDAPRRVMSGPPRNGVKPAGPSFRRHISKRHSDVPDNHIPRAKSPDNLHEVDSGPKILEISKERLVSFLRVPKKEHDDEDDNDNTNDHDAQNKVEIASDDFVDFLTNKNKKEKKKFKLFGSKK